MQNYYTFQFLAGFAAQKQQADAYHKALKKFYQELLSQLPIDSMMDYLFEDGIITRKLQSTIDTKRTSKGNIISYMS